MASTIARALLPLVPRRRTRTNRANVGVLERLLQALHVPDPLAHELLARARELSQLLDGLERDEAPPDEPMRQQLREPLGVLDVGLASRHVLDVLGVGQDQLEALLHHVPHRLPVDPGRLHHDVRDLVEPEPIE
jgi:hypothetical protein